MLGNWSLGNYFKKEAITWTHEFITKELGFDQGQLAVTVFGGDENTPGDDTSYNVWLGIGYPKERIFRLGYNPGILFRTIPNTVFDRRNLP